MLRARLSLFEFESRANPDATVPELPPVGGETVPPPITTPVVTAPPSTPTSLTESITNAAGGTANGAANETNPYLAIDPLTGLPFVQ